MTKRADHKQDPNLVIYAKVSPCAYRGWHRYAKAHGVTVVALIEAMGRISDGPVSDIPEEEFSPVFQQLLEMAREITAERRRRKP